MQDDYNVPLQTEYNAVLYAKYPGKLANYFSSTNKTLKTWKNIRL
jgi:hypothetical protein